MNTAEAIAALERDNQPALDTDSAIAALEAEKPGEGFLKKVNNGLELIKSLPAKAFSGELTAPFVLPVLTAASKHLPDSVNNFLNGVAVSAKTPIVPSHFVRQTVPAQILAAMGDYGKGASDSLSETLAGFSTPENLAVLAAVAPESVGIKAAQPLLNPRATSAVFATQVASMLPAKVEAWNKASADGTDKEKGAAGADLALHTVMAGALIHHARQATQRPAGDAIKPTEAGDTVKASDGVAAKPVEPKRAQELTEAADAWASMDTADPRVEELVRDNFRLTDSELATVRGDLGADIQRVKAKAVGEKVAPVEQPAPATESKPSDAASKSEPPPDPNDPNDPGNYEFTETAAKPEQSLQPKTGPDTLGQEANQSGGVALPEKSSTKSAAKVATLEGTGFHDHPLIQFLSGRLMSKSAAKAAGKLDKLAQEYDDVPALTNPKHNKIYGGELTPDEAAQMAFDKGLLPDNTPQTLWKRIGEISKGGENLKLEADIPPEIVEMDKVMSAIAPKNGETGIPIENVSQFKGKSKVKAEPDPDRPDTHTRVKNDVDFTVPNDTLVSPSMVAKKAKPMKLGAEFAPDEAFKLAPPETEAEASARKSEEATAAQERQAALAEETRKATAQREELSKLGRPIGGDMGSAGQGALFETPGQQEIFQPTAPRVATDSASIISKLKQRNVSGSVITPTPQELADFAASIGKAVKDLTPTDMAMLRLSLAGAQTGKESDGFFHRPTVDDLIDPSARPNNPPSVTPVTFMQHSVDAIRGVKAGPSMMQSVRGWLGTMAGKSMPKTTLRNRTLGELGSRYAASRIAAQPIAEVFVNDVMAGLPLDQAKFHAALLADNHASVKRGFLDEAFAKRMAGDVQGALAAEESARNVADLFAAKDFPFKSQAELAAYFRQPEVIEAVKRHVDNWNATLEPMFKEAMGLDPETELPPRGEISGARINLNPVKDMDSKPRGKVVGGAGGSLTGTMRRRDPFASRASASSDNYILNYAESIANSFGRRLEVSNKRVFDDALVSSENAVIGRTGASPELPDGEATVGFPLRRGAIGIGGKAIPTNFNIYVRKSLAKEYEIASNVVVNPYRDSLLVQANRAWTQAALVGLTDATVHISNLATTLLQAPGATGFHPVIDSILSAAYRLDAPVIAVRMGLKAAPDIARTKIFQQKLAQHLPGFISNALNRALLKNLTQFAALAEINAARTPSQHGIPGLRTVGDLIHEADRTTRLVMDDAYKNLVENGLVENSETARREWINQAGNYNMLTQGPWVRFLRQTGLGPFVTAGRNYNVLAVRGMTLNPGVKAASNKAAVLLKANMLAKWVGTAALAATCNYLVTGKMLGRPGVPLGAIDTGEDDDSTGGPRYYNVMNLTGQGRAMRVTGVRGAVESLRSGLDANAAAGSAVRDVTNSAMGPIMGPFPRFASIAASGYSPAVGVGRASPVAPHGGFEQVALNVATAAIDSNPLFKSLYDAAFTPGSTFEDALKHQLPRFTMQAVTGARSSDEFPRIVEMAQANEFMSDVIHRARNMPPDERMDYVRSKVEKLNPLLQGKAWKEVYHRRVFAPVK